MEDIFGSAVCYRQSAEREKTARAGERVMPVTGRERQCVRSGAPGPFGWLTLNGCPGEVTGLIESRLRGEGNAFALRLAP